MPVLEHGLWSHGDAVHNVLGGVSARQDAVYRSRVDRLHAGKIAKLKEEWDVLVAQRARVGDVTRKLSQATAAVSTDESSLAAIETEHSNLLAQRDDLLAKISEAGPSTPVLGKRAASATPEQGSARASKATCAGPGTGLPATPAPVAQPQSEEAIAAEALLALSAVLDGAGPSVSRARATQPADADPSQSGQPTAPSSGGSRARAAGAATRLVDGIATQSIDDPGDLETLVEIVRASLSSSVKVLVPMQPDPLAKSLNPAVDTSGVKLLVDFQGNVKYWVEAEGKAFEGAYHAYKYVGLLLPQTSEKKSRAATMKDGKGKAIKEPFEVAGVSVVAFKSAMKRHCVSPA